MPTSIEYRAVTAAGASVRVFEDRGMVLDFIEREDTLEKFGELEAVEVITTVKARVIRRRASEKCTTHMGVPA